MGSDSLKKQRCYIPYDNCAKSCFGKNSNQNLVKNQIVRESEHSIPLFCYTKKTAILTFINLSVIIIQNMGMYTFLSYQSEVK